jgi:hypothetical protein
VREEVDKAIVLLFGEAAVAIFIALALLSDSGGNAGELGNSTDSVSVRRTKAMTAAQAQQGPIQIDWKTDGSVSVVGQNRHRFLITMQQAAEACARGHEQLIFAEEFKNVLARVHEWIKLHQASISTAYFAVVERQLVFFISPRSERMDFALSDEISQLEVELYHDFANVRCEVRQIPGHEPEALRTFLDLEQAILLHGNPVAASKSVAP